MKSPNTAPVHGRFAKLAAGALVGAALGSTIAAPAEALPSPLPVTQTAEQRLYRDQQTIQRQIALGIAGYMSQDTTEDVRTKGPVEVEIIPDDGSVGTIDINRGYLPMKPDVRGRMAAVNLQTRLGQGPLQAVFYAERGTSAGDRRIIMTASINPEITNSINQAAAQGRAPEADILLQIVSDPEATFDTDMMKAPHDRGFAYDIGGDGLSIDGLSVDTLQQKATEYTDFIGMTR